MNRRDKPVELPGATICHRSPNRIRLKVTSRKGDADYFSNLLESLSRFQDFERLEVSALTGSVLIVDEQADLDTLADYARAKKLFEITARGTFPSPMTTQLVSHLENVNTSIRRWTAGEMDLAGILLLLLLVTGLAELLRGKLRMPPWYTAFWYAFGIYKLASIVKDKGSEEN
jgi:hypothetical protein